MCDLREEWLSNIGKIAISLWVSRYDLLEHNLFSGIISILMAFILPLVFGPLASFLCLLCNLMLRRGDRKKESEDFSNNFLCLALLTVVFVITYSVNMIIAEVLFDQISILSYVLMKYCFGSLHSLLSPIVIMISFPQLRKSAVKVFMRGGTQQNNSIDISEEDVKKELGHLWRYISKWKCNKVDKW